MDTPTETRTSIVPPPPAAVGHPLLDVVRGELERLFSLEDLLKLSVDSLGLEPDVLGGTSAKGSFARALVDACAKHEAVEALVDAMLIAKNDVDPRVREIAAVGLSQADEVASSTELGRFTITKKLGEGGAGLVYLANVKDGSSTRQTTLKVLKREAARDMRSLQRFLTANRMIGAVDHPGLPKNLRAGNLPDGRLYISYDYIDGQTLASRIQRTGPMHINEAKPILKGILETLAALHGRRIAHGDLKTENVLLAKDAAGTRVVLVDFGTDRLRARGRTALHQTGILAVYGSAKAMAPELVKGHIADSKSDVYALGALLWEVLTGKPLFAKEGLSSLEIALSHMSTPADAPSSAAPRGWVSKELDKFVLDLLHKEPTQRPSDAKALLEALDKLGKVVAVESKKTFETSELESRIEALKGKPEDGELAANLEKAIEDGAETTAVAAGFAAVAEGLTAAEAKEDRRGLLLRAARLYTSAKAYEPAEKIYLGLVEANDKDDVAQAALEDIKMTMGQWGDLVEMLLSRVDSVDHGKERAGVYAEIARLYEGELEDPDNAFVAWVQAYCEEPRENDYGRDVERLAGNSEEKWDEALGQTAHKVQVEGVSSNDKLALFVQMGKWFVSKVNRLDLALPSYQAAIAIEPANEAALEGLCEVYRRAQQWPELGAVLMRRADANGSANRARDLRAQAAEILEHKLSDASRAKDLYQAIVNEDPAHPVAAPALERICEKTGDFQGLVKMIDNRAGGLRGPERAEAMARIAEVYENQIGDINEATRRYDAVLAIDPRSLPALKGLDRIYNRQGKYRELLENLEKQVEIAATPRQKIGLYERKAAIYDEEFLDHEKAAEKYESILKIDGGHNNALVALGRHYRALNRWEDVAALYERHLKVVEDTNRRIELLLARGRVLGEQIGSPERAMLAFEKVLELNSEHAGALEALARLRETSGDANSAVAAVESLAAKAATPEAKAELYVRAAKLLEGRGDKDGAIERYKLALECNPNDKGASASLRAAYAARGDVAAAIAMVEREVENAQTPLQKARLLAEMANLALHKLKDYARARDNATKALAFDPTNVQALFALGETAYETEKWVEVAQRLESVATRSDALPKEDGVRALFMYVDALVRIGASARAVKAAEKLQSLASDDARAMLRVGQVIFEHGEAKACLAIHVELIDKLGDRFVGAERALVLYRLGESARKLGDHERAQNALEEASDLDPTMAAPLEALSKLHEDREEWADVVSIRKRALDIASGDEHFRIMVDLGEVLANKIKDRAGAAKQFVAALDERPDDRGVMLKLMQLYSEASDWSKLVEVVMRMGDLASDVRGKARYWMTAATITEREMKDARRAADLYEQVLEIEPANDHALAEAIKLRGELKDDESTERLLKVKLERAKAGSDKPAQVAALDALGEMYHRRLGRVDDAIAAYESAQELDPEKRERGDLLADIYASDAGRFLDKAVKAQSVILKRNPYKADAFKLLRKLYTQAKRADAAWCICQALSVLKLGEADEDRFYRRHRAETAAPAQDVLTPEDWANLVKHPDRDPLLTGIFAIIQPAIITARATTLEQEGYPPNYAVDLSLDPFPMSQTLYYASGVLGLEQPIVFHNRGLDAGIQMIHSNPRALVLGRGALETGDIPAPALAFLAGQKLAFFQPGLYVRQLVSNMAGLKAWLFGAIKTIVPNFPVANDLTGPVQQAMGALATLHPNAKDQLASMVGKLLQTGSIDLKRWIATCDLTADRAAMLLCHDLDIALAMIKAVGEDPSVALTSHDRQKEMILFATSEEYFALRERLVVTIDQ